MKHIVLGAVVLMGLPVTAQNDGPDAPDVTYTYESPTGFRVDLSNPPGSNNAGNMYAELIQPPQGTEDPFWRMQGYMMYQLSSLEPPEDLAAAIHDFSVARPVLGLDVDDNIGQLTDRYDPPGAAECVLRNWTLVNSGLDMSFYAVMDPFTFQPFVQGQRYCFVMVAFASNLYHIDPDCGELDQMLFSQQAAGGALEVQCVLADPFAGISEAEAGAVFQAYPNPANGSVQLRFPDAGQRRLRILDARGALVEQHAVVTEQQVPLDALAPGVYAFELTGRSGRAVQRVAVQ